MIRAIYFVAFCAMAAGCTTTKEAAPVELQKSTSPCLCRAKSPRRSGRLCPPRPWRLARPLLYCSVRLWPR